MVADISNREEYDEPKRKPRAGRNLPGVTQSLVIKSKRFMKGIDGGQSEKARKVALLQNISKNVVSKKVLQDNKPSFLAGLGGMLASKQLQKLEGVVANPEWQKSKIEDKFYIDPELGERIVREKNQRETLAKMQSRLEQVQIPTARQAKV